MSDFMCDAPNKGDCSTVCPQYAPRGIEKELRSNGMLVDKLCTIGSEPQRLVWELGL